MSVDLKDRAELLEVIGVMVDALRRFDVQYCKAHEVEVVTDEELDIALAAGEEALEANEPNVCPDCHGKGGTAPNGVQYCNCDETPRHIRVITGTGGAGERKELNALIRGLQA